MTKSPIKLAKMALACARQVLDPYPSPYSRHDFTQPQIFAILTLKTFFRTDYRGIVDLIADFSDLRQALGLTKVPHYSTLCYAEKRLLTYSNEPSFLAPGSCKSFAA